MRFVGIKREHGADDPNRDQNRDCPRNCERRANLEITTDQMVGKARKAVKRKSGDLPISNLTRFGRGVPRGCDDRILSFRKMQLWSFGLAL